MARMWVVAVLIIILAFATSALSASVNQSLYTDLVREALNLPDGAECSLPGVFCSDVIFPYAFVNDLYGNGPHLTLAVFLGKYVVSKNYSLNIHGTMMTLGADRVLIASYVEIYTNPDGSPLEHPFPCRALPWDYLVPADTNSSVSSPSTGILPPIPTPEPKSIVPISARVGTVAAAKIGEPAVAQSLSSVSISSTPPQLLGGSVALEQKIVTAVFYVPNTPTVDYFYICDADNPIGIKVDPQGAMYVDVIPGDVVSVAGTVIASSSTVPECYIDPTSCVRTDIAAIPKPLAFSQRVTAGGVFGLQQALCSDATLTPVVMGSGLKSNVDGADRTGIRLIYPADSPTIYNTNDYLMGITGILGAENANGSPVPVIRCSRINVKLTTPPAGELHVASGATSVLLAGTASSPGIGIASVKVGFGTTEPVTWHDASYNSTTLTWAYSWSSPAGSKIWVRAYDLAGNATQIWRDVTVTTGVQVVYVSKNGNNTTGDSWANAKTTIAGGIGAAVAAGKTRLWIAEGTYPEKITVPDTENSIELYGGFVSGDTYLEQRDWNKHPVIIGNASGTSHVITINGKYGYIDGLTIQGGNNGGISCSGIYTARIYNCVIRNNSKSGNGGGLYCTKSVYIVNSIFEGNSAAYGSAVYFNPSSTNYKLLCLTNCSIVGNKTNSDTLEGAGGAIYWASDANVYMSNNIVACNSSGIWSTTAGNGVRNNCVYANPSGNFIGGFTPQADNIVRDPLFVNAEEGDYHLTAASPCIDMGNDDASALLALDIDRGPRKVGTIDIGADEADITAPYYLGIDADRIEVPVGESAKITACVLGSDGPVTGCQVSFTSPTGTLTLNNNGLTDSDGKASATLTSSSAGTITVTVSATATTTKTIDITFFTGSAREDWPMFHHDIALSGVTTASVGANPAAVADKWNGPVTLKGSASNETHWSSPVVYDGVVYVGTSDNTTGWIYAIDAVSGGVLAKLKLGSPVIGTPCVHNGVIYVPTQGGGWLYANSTWNDVGRVVALKLNTTTNVFESQWEYICPNVSDEIWGSTTVYDGAVYFGRGTRNANTSNLCTIDLITRAQRSGGPVAMVYPAECITPSIDANYVNPNTSQPEPRVYASDYSCYVTAAKCKTGEKVWDKSWDSSSMYASPVIYSGHIYVGSDYNCIYKIEDPGNSVPGEVDGGDVWRVTLDPLSSVKSTPAVLNGKLYYGSDDGHVYRLDAGTFLQNEASISMGANMHAISAPAISSSTGLIFMSSYDDTYNQNTSVLRVLSVSDLSNPKYFDIAGKLVKSSPAVISGRAFVIAGDGNGRYLYCFGD